MALLTPDRYFSRISAIDIERDLLGCGLTHVLLDIDNTVRARDTGCVPRDVGMWLGRAREARGELLFALEQLACRCVPVRRRAGAAHRGQGLKAAAAGVSRGPAQDWGSRRRHGRRWRSAGDRCAGSPSDGHEGLYAAAAGRAGSAHTLLLRNVERAILGDRKPEPAINIAECEASRPAARRGQGSAPRRFGQGAQRGVEGASRETGRESL